VIRRLKAQLRGRRDDLRDIPVDLAGVGDFSRKVLLSLRGIGPGRTVTYGELAARSGKPRAARAVGRIMGANPVPLIVPCHRCVGAGGKLTGFSSEGGVMLKAQLLHAEGVVCNAEHARGMKTLARRDPVLRKLIRSQPPYTVIDEDKRSGYEILVVAIVHQQLSVKAGRTIAGRVRDLTPGPDFPRPEQMLAIPDADLRACGLSNMKVSFVKDLAARVADGRLNLTTLHRLDDEAAIARLTEVKGIGRWSAQMHLLFHLGRLDIWAVDDLGLQKGAVLLYDLPEPVTKAAMEELGERWRPYRSIASWYLWRALDAGGV
jgi:methylated-DNA-[protein]-cysteine S-methyltransferase